MAALRVGVIGAGRAGAVLAGALRAAGHDVVAVSGSSAASAARIAAMLPGVPVRAPLDVAPAAELLLLAVPDDALVDLVDRLAESGSAGGVRYAAHTSGRHGPSVLHPLSRLGVRALALHPAMTFTGTPADLPRLAGCVLTLTADPAEREFAEALGRDLGARTAWIAEESRTRYHAGLAHGANHLATLVAQAIDLLGQAGLDDPQATLRPLLTAALDNALTLGDAALTGPVVRGDVQTVSAHLAELARAAPAVLGAYVALARATVQRARADGRLPAERAEELDRQLDAYAAERTA